MQAVDLQISLPFGAAALWLLPMLPSLARQLTGPNSEHVLLLVDAGDTGATLLSANRAVPSQPIPVSVLPG